MFAVNLILQDLLYTVIIRLLTWLEFQYVERLFDTSYQGITLVDRLVFEQVNHMKDLQKER